MPLSYPGPVSCFLPIPHSLVLPIGRGCNLMTTGRQVLLPEGPYRSAARMEGLEPLIAVASLFSSMAERAPFLRLPQCLGNKESTCRCTDSGDADPIPALERSPGGGHGNPLQFSCLENPMGRGAWWATVHGIAKSDKTEATYHACTPFLTQLPLNV